MPTLARTSDEEQRTFRMRQDAVEEAWRGQRELNVAPFLAAGIEGKDFAVARTRPKRIADAPRGRSEGFGRARRRQIGSLGPGLLFQVEDLDRRRGFTVGIQS